MSVDRRDSLFVNLGDCFIVVLDMFALLCIHKYVDVERLLMKFDCLFNHLIFKLVMVVEMIR